MPPNDNYGANDIVGADDFVIVIDRPVPNASFQDVIGNSPIETGYVTVNAMITATEDTPTAPEKHDGNILKMDKFEPILLRMFPNQMKQVALMAPVPTADQALNDEVNGVPITFTTFHPNKVFIKNAVLLFECFFHFKGLYPKIGRESMLYLVGKACQLNPEKSISLQELVARIFDALADSREMFMVLNQDFSVLDAEDYGVRELAWLAESYVYFQPEEPQQVSEEWYKDPAVDSLWNEWQDILKNKGLRFNKPKREPRKNNPIY